MDRSFGSSFLSNRSPFSPKTKLNDSRRSAFRRSSRISVSGKSAQSINQIIVKSKNYYAETFGQPLPVLVTEALTFSEQNTVVSAHVSNNGYAWLVCGRRLLIWQYRQFAGIGTPQRKGALSNQCIELKLPQSDLAHKADLVSVFVSGSTHTASCVAASPEGVVRYWPSIAHEGVSIEECVDLQGQECDSLTETDGLGCILATTTCTIVLVQPSIIVGRHTLSCKLLKTPTGWLGGLGKKMSSLIFGPISTEQSAETRLVRVLKVPINEKSRYIYVVTGDSLQKWKLGVNEPEQLLFVTDLNDIISQAFVSTVWDNCNRSQSKLDTWILDLQHDRESVVLLVAAAQTALSPQVHYALAYIDINSCQPPTILKHFSMLKIADLYRDDKPAEHLNYRFIVLGPQVFVYDMRTIIVCAGQADPEGLEFHSPRDYLLCGCICVNVPIFFTRKYGLVSVCSNDSEINLNATTASLSTNMEMANDSVNNLTLYSIDPEEVASSFKATEDQLRAAFIFHLQTQYAACRNILDEIFPVSDTTPRGGTGKMDNSILNICKMLLDDQPTGDPRWTRGHEVGIGSSYSMLIMKQLEDKQKALSLYYKFLKETGLWARLSCVVERDCTICTTYILGEYAERVIVALTLKNYPVNEILEKAIDQTVNIYEDEDSGLTHQDLFYKDVTKVHQGLQQIVNICEQMANSAINPHEIGKTIVKSNEIILAVLDQVMQYRQKNVNNFIPSEEVRNECPEYMPWTVANGVEGLHDALVLQQSLTYNHGIRNTSVSTLHNTMYDQYVYFVDIILDGHKNHLKSTLGTEKEEVLLKQYEKDRHNMIKPLIFDKQWERAALLAEKYLDFETLVVLCERTNNEQRLDEYIDRFSSQGFPQYVYSWFLQENKQGKLIKKCKSARDAKHNQTLINFLSDHPSLSWIQSVMNKEYSKAADILQHLAIQETESLCRQKTMLSLSKLAKLSAENDISDNSVQNINSYLELVEFQEEIPDYVLQQFGYDTVKPAVIPPIKMIHLYTCSEYKDATELDFKKALDLLPYVNQDAIDSCKVEIWRRAILRDLWNEKNVESPLEVLQNKLFFKLAELTSDLGNNLQAIMPPIDQLADDPELRLLQVNKTFQFLLKTAYEHFFQS